MSSSIVFLGDPHLSDRQISTRVDDTTETCLEKFEWVLDYARNLSADIICTGDMFTSTLASNKTRFRIKTALRDFKLSGRMFFSVSGNHRGDVNDRDFSSVIYRELGQLCFDGYIKFLGSWGGSLYDYQVGTVFTNESFIRGYSAYSDLDVSEPEKVVGLVCHHWIMDAFGDSLVVYPDDMKKIFPNLKFIVAGHDHAYHDPYTSRDGVLVVRPGSMMRTDAGDSSKRIPCVAVLHLDGQWESVPIAVARPYAEVFYSEKKGIDKGSASALSRFVQQMQGQASAVMDINTAIKEQLALVPVGDQDMVKADLVDQGFVI